jgi:hypothetical protein
MARMHPDAGGDRGLSDAGKLASRKTLEDCVVVAL